MQVIKQKASLSSMKIAVYILLYTIGFCMVFNFRFRDSAFCVAHAILAVVAMNCTLKTIELTQKFRGIPISLGGLCLYTINMYFVLSIVKYGTTMVYAEFEHDNWFRFIGTIICFISIMITNYTVRNQQRKSGARNAQRLSDISIQNNMPLTTFLMILVCIVLLYESVKKGSYYNTTREWNTPIEAVISIFLDVVSYLVLVMAVNEIKKGSAFSYVPVVLFAICMLLRATISGSRTEFVRPLIVILYALIMLNKIDVKRLQTVTCLAPIGIMLISILVFWSSNRFTNIGLDAESISRNMGYRFDLSDFAINCMSRSKYMKIDFANLWSGVLQATPSAFLPKGFKSKNVVSYTNMLNKLGLSSWKDYTDSYFSMGAEVLGVFGMIFVPTLFVSLFEMIDCHATQKHAQGILIKTVIALWATTIERNWNEMIPLLRNIAIYIVIALFFERLFITRKKRSERMGSIRNT